MSDDNNDNVIDISGYGAAQTYSDISYSSGIDTITLDPNIYGSGSITVPTTTSTITLPPGGAGGGSFGTLYTGGGGGGGGGTTYTLSGAGSSAWTTSYNNTPNVTITEKGIDMREGSDIKVGGRSLTEFMEKMEERMAILTVDPAKMEKFAALKKAYENYKLMEKLCQEEDTKEEDK